MRCSVFVNGSDMQNSIFIKYKRISIINPYRIVICAILNCNFRIVGGERYIDAAVINSGGMKSVYTIVVKTGKNIIV